MKIDIDDGFKVQVLESNSLEIRNNKKYRLLDMSYIIAVEIGAEQLSIKEIQIYTVKTHASLKTAG